MKIRSDSRVPSSATCILLACFAVVAGGYPVRAQVWAPVIHITNHVWRFLGDGPDQGTAWREPGFDDSTWSSGIGLFGFESTPAVYPFAFQSLWPPIDGRLTYYARTHFRWDGPLNWPDVLFRLTNYIDDGAVFYLDGLEVGRVRLTNEIVGFDTPAQVAAAEGQADVLDFRVPFMTRGDHVLAVEIHNATPVSHDIVFGLSMEGIECHLDVFPQVTPNSQSIEECQPATLTLLSPSAFGPEKRWIKNGVPLSWATNNLLVIPRVGPSDQGMYYVEVATLCNTQRSNPAWLFVKPDTTPPQPVRAVADSTLTNLTISFNEPLDPTSIDDTHVIVDDVCLLGRLQTQFAALVDATNVLVTTSPRRLDQNYLVQISGIRDACAGNLLASNATVLLNPILSLTPLRLVRVGAGLEVSWTGCGVLQSTSDLVQWADVPGPPSSPYSAATIVDSRFYRLRLP